MIELNWGGFGTSLVAGRLIARKQPLALSLHGEAAEILRRLAAPGVTLNRELLGRLASNLSLATLPGLMLLALGLGYAISYENLTAQGIRILFTSGQAGQQPPTGAEPGRQSNPQGH